MPIGPAMTTLKSTVAFLALMLRCAGIADTVVQVLIWHSFYSAVWWRLAIPVLAVAWATTMTVVLRRGWPSPFLACLDSAVYVALALGAQGCVPPAVRDDAFSWLVISMSGQLIVSAWYAPGALFALLALASPVAYWAGAMIQPVRDRATGLVKETRPCPSVAMTASPMLESTAESHRSFASARRRAAWSTSTSVVIITPPAAKKAS